MENRPDLRGGGEEHSCVSMKSGHSKWKPPDFSGGGEEHSCVSMKSDWSKGIPPDFSGGGEEHSCVSMKSNHSKWKPPDFSGGGREHSCVSMKSDHSKWKPPDFSGGGKEHSCVSMKSDWSKGKPPDFSGGAAPSNSEQRSSEVDLNIHTQLGVTGPVQQDLHQPAHNDLLKVIDKHKTCMKNKYETLFEGITTVENKTLLNRIYTQLYIIEGETEGVNKEHEVLQMEKTPRRHIEDTPSSINCSDIFKPLQDDLRPKKRKVDKELRTVLTKGIAGIGKTVSVQKFILDWAEGKANQDVDFMFVLPFRELNLIEDNQYSLHEVLCVFHPQLKDLDPKIFEEHKVVFIFDGLDESRIALDFSNRKKLCKKSDITMTSSISALMANLFSGELLPSARIWITCRPAAAHKIPPEHISRVTEIQGFNDPQKEEYFRKRISDQDQAQKIISHIKTTRSLHIMCHIPVFCWISSTVLQEIMKQGHTEIPKTLTEMYSYFLITQVNRKEEKYEWKDETDPEKLLESNRTNLLKLAELAFEQLMKKNVMFYKEDLRECGIDVTEASVYSGVFTEIFREECVIYQRKVYSFVHLSFQEFLAAVYLFHCYERQNMKVLWQFEELSRKYLYDPFDDPYYDSSDSESISGSINSEMCYDHSESSVDNRNSEKSHCRDLNKHVSLNEVLIGAVYKAVKSQNGHLDLFLRFLLGISLESNQRLLQGLLNQTHTLSEEVTEFIKRLIKKESEIGFSSTERAINLFLCLSEVNDQSLSREIQEYLQSENQSEKRLSPGQCSALVCMLLTSEEVLEELDLKKYNTSERGYGRLIPAVTACRRAVLVGCNITSYVCDAVFSVLESVNSSLKELDLSENELRDYGVELLSKGLKSSHCKLEKLRLSFCMVTEEGCSYLASALKSNPFYLRELDLSYNHPGESGVKLLSELQEDPQCKLETLRVDHGGEIRLKRGIVKYARDLTLDPNTASSVLSLSDGNREVKRVEADQRYPDHPDRFECWGQVLSAESLTGRCYWEVKWSGKQRPVIAMSYRGIRRKGHSEDSQFGQNNQSWSLEYFNNSYCVYHNKEKISELYHPYRTERVGVYVDWKAGILKFFSRFSDTDELTPLHTVQTTFTEPLYAGFRVFESVCVCKLE
ncbi:NACHT, LRR and PYD domains-containing protein 3 [Astyanax mexicanus]|uniref:NACHT, LRR and PYD domains-containing protein 3 n=1 Tax=Astyanax mexicanus TaxID=7994 RepID=UPI0020CAE3B9|nr:NACHT, LRR and PYD domains-containing protein 3 [Astyanax mexicanus]XP_049340691.1 NACHT, LRR and PYD domains-containing protein 3 [Astyanax mexicanus]